MFGLNVSGINGVLLSLAVINFIFVLIFWALRVIVIGADAAAFVRTDATPVEAWGDGLYHSIMTQSTVGASDMLPASSAARLVTGLQSASTLLSLFLMAELGRRRIKAK